MAYTLHDITQTKGSMGYMRFGKKWIFLKQNHPKSCGIASIRILLLVLGLPDKTEDELIKCHPVWSKNPNYVFNGSSREDRVKIMKALSNDNIYKNLKKVTNMKTHSFVYTFKKMSVSNPGLVSVKWKNGGSHMMVGVGPDLNDKSKGWVIDPMCGPVKIKIEKDPVSYSYQGASGTFKKSRISL